MARLTPVNTGFTILEGVGTGANGHRIDVWAEYAFGQSDTVANTTPITVYFYTALNPAYTSATVSNHGLDSALQVGGVAATGVSGGAYDFRSSENIHLLGFFTGDMPHGEDGTGTVRITGSFTTASSYISGGNLAATVALPAIARQTTLSVADCTIGQTAQVRLSVKNPAYVHAIAYQFGDLQGYLTPDGGVTDSRVLFSQTEVPFALPEVFYSQIPDATQGICTLACTTYLDDTPVGTPQSAQFRVYTDQAACAPVLGVEAVDINSHTLALTGDERVLIPGFSRVRCKILAQPQKYAAIASLSVAGVQVEGGTAEFLLEGDTDLTVSVTDSRGYTVTASPDVTVLSYVPVTNLAQIRRDSPTATTATLTLSGSFWAGSFGMAENTLTVQLEGGQAVQPQWTMEAGRYYGVVQLEGLDYTKSHSIPVTVSDSVCSAQRTVNLQKGIPVFDWGEEDFVFHVPVSAPALNSPELTDILERLQKLEEKHASN